MSPFLRAATLAVFILSIHSHFRIADAQTAGDGAVVFTYQPKDGQQAQFEEGYRRHLEWHRNAGDRLTWYAWYQIVGPEPGLFIDGVFGVDYTALDQRVQPVQDQADFAKTTAPFAELDYRSMIRLRRDLSTASLLEEGNPSRMIQIVEVTLKSGREETFEDALRAVRSTDSEAMPYSWYETIVGGNEAAYLLMIPRASFGDLDAMPAPVRALARLLPAGAERDGFLERWTESVGEITSSLWLFRPDLTYLPEN